MDPEKQKALEAAGYVFGDYADFLGLTDEEKVEVEIRARRKTQSERSAEIFRRIREAQSKKFQDAIKKARERTKRRGYS